MDFEDSDEYLGSANRRPTGFSVRGDLADLSDTILKLRALKSLGISAQRFPIHRRVRFAARRPLEELFDDLAQRSGLAALRLDTAWLILDGPRSFVEARGTQKTDYCSGTFSMWTDSRGDLESFRDQLLGIVGEQLVRDETFTIDWHFHSAYSGLTSVAFEEIADPQVPDEAYPSIGEPVASFIEHYLDSQETVLVLQGPPGTGKTRLVRAILAAISRRKRDGARVIYTADRRTLENDEIFVEFVTGRHDAFVVEDADHLLQARCDGNTDLHRFLAIADGVVRAQGRKMIFTTNLANVGDIDDALVRPGRCFCVLRTRCLNQAEAGALVARLCRNDSDRLARLDTLLAKTGANQTLAEIYRLVGAGSSRQPL